MGGVTLSDPFVQVGFALHIIPDTKKKHIFLSLRYVSFRFFRLQLYLKTLIALAQHH